MSTSKNFFLADKKARMRSLVSLIQKNPELPFHKIKGIFMWKTGLSSKKIDEYINDLIEGDLIEFVEDTRNYKVLLPENC